jgi:hypothetical protein
MECGRHRLSRIERKRDAARAEHAFVAPPGLGFEAGEGRVADD